MALVAIQMDPPESINPKSDSTLLLALEAQRRGYELVCYTPHDLSLRGGELSARVRPVTFRADPGDYFTAGHKTRFELAQAKVVLMRQDPPFDMGYITATFLLEQLPPATLVVNDPFHVRNEPEKLFPLLLKEFMPPTLISTDLDEINDFRKEQGEIIVKPLYGHGGNAVFHSPRKDPNFQALMELMLTRTREPLVIQRFLPEVKDQDRRIMLVDGAVAGVMGRIPAEGEIRANFRVGGTGAKAELTPRQRLACEALGPELKKRGLIFAGLDMIGDWLTEVNITSPTGLAGMHALYGVSLERQIWDAIEARL